ncbi:MAG: HEAT repeat domain-containing protein [Acidobacteriota bacterium]
MSASVLSSGQSDFEMLDTSIIILASVAAAFLAAYNILRRPAARPLDEEARSLGLVILGGTDWLHGTRWPKMSGTVRGQSVSVGLATHPTWEGNVARTILTVSPPNGIPHAIQATREGGGSGHRRVFAGDDTQTGDREFDDMVLISGDSEGAVISLLDMRTRELMRQLVGIEGWEITGGALHRDVSDLVPEPGDLIAMLQTAAELSERLGRWQGVEQLLIDNMLGDSNPTVRRRNLELLLRMDRSPSIETALERAASEDDWSIAVPAAGALGERGIPRLAAAAMAAPTPHAIQAVRALKALGGDRTLTFIRATLDSAQDDVTIAAVAALAEWRDSASVPVLCEITRSRRGAALRAAAARAIGRFDDPRAHETLLEVLRDNETAVRLAAIESLGERGVAADVTELMEIEKGSPPRVRAAARQAVAAIQARLGSVERGWVSMAEQAATSGALSVAGDAPAGALSVADRVEKEPQGG